jgi:glutathione S-transferase
MAQRLKLVLGNKNFSSWSLRPWLVLKHVGVPFDEQVIPLDQPETRAQILAVSPSGRVPCLVDGELAVWDSLAIAEYLNEKFPEKQLWPKDAAARAMARSVSAEMHSGFQALRTAHPMKFRDTCPARPVDPEVKKDVDRIQEIWRTSRTRHGKSGPFLFGSFSIADAMYAPVASRFRTYAIPLERDAAAYVDALFGLPSMQEWLEAAKAETHRMARYEKQP